MTAAYLWRPRTKARAERSRSSSTFRGPVVGLAIPLAVIGTAAFAQYVRVTGGLNLASPLRQADADLRRGARSELHQPR